jgi:type IV secretory pathway VirB2 component (pilin)
MKKILLIAILLSLVLTPFTISAAIVPCQNGCTINDFFTMLGNIYDFVAGGIAGPLAIVAIIIGGMMMILSAGNPALFARGKQVLLLAVIGLLLTYGSKLIIDTLLNAMGYRY